MKTTLNTDGFKRRPQLTYRFRDGKFELVPTVQARKAWGPEFEEHANQAIALLHPVAQPELAARVSNTTLKLAG